MKKLKIDSVWRVFSPFIKEILENIYGNQCVTCPKNNLEGNDRQLGHFLPKKAYPTIRWWIENLGIQCSRCNGFKDGEQFKFSKWIEKNLGTKVLTNLMIYAHKPNYTIGQYEYKMMLDKIKFYKEQLKNKKMTHKEIYDDIIKNQFGLFI